jgi:glycosyltransferase involved in cell wall biosynthesis
LRVVIVSDFGEVNGGAAKVAVASARGLAESGVPVRFVCAVPPVSPQLSHSNITVDCLQLADVWARKNPLAAAAQGIWSGQVRAALERIVAPLAGTETLVHFHQWTKAFSPSVLSVPAQQGLPSVVSLHDYFFVCPNGAYYRYAEEKPCSVEPMSMSCVTARCDRHSTLHKAVRVARQAATTRAVKRANGSMSVLHMSNFAAQIAGRFIAEEHASYVVPSPIEVERWLPVDVARNTGFLFAGRLTEEKGVKLLAKTARDAGLPLTIAGDGPLLPELQAVGGSVACTGWLDAAALAATMRRARALVFPSTWFETGGLVVLEALAQGIPVIVSRTTGAADFIEHGSNGLLIEPGNWKALRTAMMTLNDPETAGRMGREAYARYWANPLSLQAHTSRLIEVYRTVLDRHVRTKGNA